MWAAAICTRTILCTLVYSVAILVYNEGGFAKTPIFKNLLGAIGLTCYCWGATIILGIVIVACQFCWFMRDADHGSRS